MVGEVTTPDAQSGAGLLYLEVSRLGDRLAVSVQEGLPTPTKTLKQYETQPYSQSVIHRLCTSILAVLNRANRRNGGVQQNFDEIKRAGQRLFDELLPLAVKTRVRTSGASVLILSIDDQLVPIPWELLFDGDRFLCLKYRMGRLVRTQQDTTYAEQREISSPIDMLVLTDPRGDLPASRK